MSELPDERAAEHLDAAENYLAIAEDANNALTRLHATRNAPVQIGEGEDEPAPDWYDRKQAMNDAFENAAVLAELHRKMAETCGQQPLELTATPSVEEMGEAIRTQMKADDDAYQSTQLGPGIDPEPTEDGELWAVGDGWFYYAVAPAHADKDREDPRWLLIRHYAQFLRWRDEKGARPIPATWSEVGADIANGLSLPQGAYGAVRRPTAEERTTFYGPEPDPAPTPPEAACGAFVVDSGSNTCARCGASVQAHAPGKPLTADAALIRAARLADDADKTRTSAWLLDCADILLKNGPGAPWPPAPAYKGAVIHVEDTAKTMLDLAALNHGTFLKLLNAVLAERQRRVS